MIKNEKLRRFILFLIGLFIMSAGVAMTKHANLVVSPISSIPNIFSIKFDKLSLGTFTIIWNIILIVGQIIILKSSFEKYQIIQIPISFLFGIFVDVCLYVVSKISVNNYISQIILLIVGIFFYR